MCSPVFWSTSCDGRQVEGQEQLLRPAARRLRRLSQHQLGQRPDEAALLGDRDEHHRRHHAEVAVGPPGQRLEADDAPVPEVDDRLEMRLDLAGRHRPPQRLLDAGHALGGLLHLAREHHHLAAPRPLGLVERCLGLVQQDGRRLIAGIVERAPDGGRKPGRPLAHVVGRRQDLDQHPRLLARRLLAEHQRVEEGELVGADAGHRGLAVHGRPQPHRHLHQDVVARMVAEKVVDRLEAVQVEDAHGERRRIVGALANQPVDLVDETAQIAEPGQRVGQSQVLALPAAVAGTKRRLHCSPVFIAVRSSHNGRQPFRKSIGSDVLRVAAA